MRIKRTFYFLIATFVLLFFALSAQGEGRPFITRWKGEAGKELRIPIRGKNFKLVIKRASDNAVLETAYSLTIPSYDDGAYYKFTPTEYGELLVEAKPEGVEQICFDDWMSSYAKSLLAVEQFGSVAWKSMFNAFRNCSNMKFAEGIDTPDLSQVTSMMNMFSGCTSFNQSLNNWDVSKVTDMEKMFSGCTSFNQSLNNWDVSKVTDMRAMFDGCTSFNQSLNNWDVSKVTNMYGMFLGCTSFNQPLNNWDVSKVTDMGYMFAGCTSLTIPLNNWKVSSVTKMRGMFSGCTSFNQPLNNWDVSKVSDMGYMFDGCSSFNQPLNNWNVSSVTDMGGLFSNCSSFNQDLGTWKLEKCERLGLDDCGMSAENYSKSFVGWAAQPNIKHGLVLTLDILKCNATGEAALKHLKEKKQWVILSPFITRWKGKTGKELRIPIRTSEETKLVIKRASDEKILVNTTCKGTYSYTPTEDGELLVEVYLRDGSSIRLRDGSFEALVRVEHFGSGKWGTMQNAFSGCTNLQFAENMDAPDLSKVTDMSSMFAGCTSFNLPMNNWDVSKVTNMANLFYGCTSFNQPLNNWNVSSATNMSNMFTECSAFNQPLNNWDVSKVTNMENLFTNCSAFNQDLSKWKLEKCERLGLDNCGMSVENYSKSFVGWAAQTNLKHGLVLTLDRLKHNARGKVALKQLREKKNWEIKLLFITRWKGEVGKELNIPIGGDKYQLVIKKATDESLLVTENECSGTYSYDPTEDGELLVEAKPDGVTSFRVQDGSAEALLSIEQFGSVKWAGLSFQGAKNMQFAKEVDIPDLRQITDMSYMFSECQAFNQPLNNWDVSQVTSMSSMFSGCTSFDQPLNNWKVGRVTDMIAMFYGCSSFNHPLNNWDVSHVTNMSSMFSGCTAFNQLLNNWDVTQVTDMGSMFAGCTSFNKPLKDWTVRQVTNMEDMFSGSSAFNQDLAMWKLEKCEKLGLANCGMSVKNYNKSLMAWAAQDRIKEQLELNATGLKYTTDAKSAHETLINDKMWDIIGDELVLQTVPVTGVTLSQTELSLVKGGTTTLTATVAPSNATNQNVTWRSNNTVVATVENGTVTAVGGGNAIITVTTVEGNHTATCNVTVTVPVTGVTLSQTELTLDKGATETLTATVAPPDATNKKVAWQTDNARVAKVENGVVTAVGKGQTDIHVVTEEGNYSATCHVIVNDNTPPVAVTGVSLSQTTLSLVKGGTATLTATVSPSDATNQNVSWRSNNTAVATVENGTVTAVSEGNATITVTTEDGGHTATCSVEVKSNETNPVHVTGVSLSQTELSLVKGGTTTLTATVSPSNATNQNVSWRSNNTAVATVENGTVTAVSEGNATITVTTEDGGHTATCSVEVKSNGTNPVHVTGVTLAPATLPLKLGTSHTLVASVEPANATNKGVTWSSDNDAVASVSNKGVVEAKTVGNATITVTTEDGGHTATCEVSVTAEDIVLTGITISPSETTLEVDKETTLSLNFVPITATHKGVKWSSNNPTIATVDEHGKVKGIAAGETTITVVSEKYESVTNTCKVTVIPPTAVEDAVFANVVVSPNPFETQLRISNGNVRGKYALYNTQGVEVASGVLETAETRINTISLPAGLYLLRLTAENGAVKTYRVVKQ